MKAMQIIAGVASLIVACVLVIELYTTLADLDKGFAGLLCVCFLALGSLAIRDAVRFEEKTWVEDLTLETLREAQKGRK